MNILVYGSTGWIGSKLVKLLEKDSNTVYKAKSRLENINNLSNELLLYETKIDHVLMAAGVTGRPNVDWCEDHRDEVMSINVVGVAVVAKWCHTNDVHLTFLGTGCIYEYDAKHLMPTDIVKTIGFTEEDEPNFEGSFYSYTKNIVQKIISEYGGLILRIRMPISDDLHPRNFITKIKNYKKVVNIPNSMTILTDLLGIIPNMMNKNVKGTYNFVNGGHISHNQILDLYKKYIDPKFEYVNFSLEEQSKILKAGRSNNTLDNTKLKKLGYDISDIQYSIHNVFKRMKLAID